MGRHHAEYVNRNKPRKRNSLVDTTLTNLRKLFDRPAITEDDERVPEYGVGDDEVTEEWLEANRNVCLPHYGHVDGMYENWEYLVQDDREGSWTGWYSVTPSAPGDENNVAAGILADWFDFNELPQERRFVYRISVRRPGAAQWQGFAEGRE